MAESVYHIPATDVHTQLSVLIDASLQSFVLLQDRNNTKAKLPFSVENIAIHRNLLDKTRESEPTGLIRIHATGKNSGDAEVLDSDGTLLIALSGIQFRRIEHDTRQQPSDEPDIKTRLTGLVMKVFCQHMNLDRDEITPKTAFGQLGLESVVAVNIVNDLRSLSGDIPSGYLLEHKSVETLVASLLADYGDDIHTYFSSTNTAVKDTLTTTNDIEPQMAIIEKVSTVDLVAQQLVVLQDIFAKAMAMLPGDFDQNVCFDKYGLESVKAIEITQELSDIYGDLPATLLFEHQTLTSLAEFIVDEKNAKCRTLGKTTGAQRPITNAPAVEVPLVPTQVSSSESDLRERVNQLTDSEVDSLLDKLLGRLSDSITEQNTYES
jgi:acyl carrier protein